MRDDLRHVRAAFVVIKLAIADDIFYLLRKNPIWNDLNFIGGHEESRDNGRLVRTASRELREEVPQTRGISGLSLIELTPELQHGPIFSKSKNQNTRYVVQFFFAEFRDAGDDIFLALGQRTKNVFVSEAALVNRSFPLSGFVDLLDAYITGGLRSIPLTINHRVLLPTWWGQNDVVSRLRVR